MIRRDKDAIKVFLIIDSLEFLPKVFKKSILNV
jgi:hypothetical protein